MQTKDADHWIALQTVSGDKNHRRYGSGFNKGDSKNVRRVELTKASNTWKNGLNQFQCRSNQVTFPYANAKGQ